MNLPWFIAKGIIQRTTGGYSGKIIKLAIVSIALSIAVMILSSLVIKGFKSEISHKIFGFWGNIHVTDSRIVRNFDLRPIQNDEELKAEIASIGSLEYTQGDSKEQRSTKGGVRNVSPYITLPSILRSKEQELEAMILKGINAEYDQGNFSEYLLEGAFPSLSDSLPSREILISQQTAKRLRLQLGDKVIIHIFKNEAPVKRQFKVCGIYRTGLEEYDRKFALIDLRIIQDLLGWRRDQVGGYEIFIDVVDDAEPIADYLHSELLSNNLYPETIQEKHRSIFEWLEFQDINERVILLLMIIVALINMSTALLILILERTKMIGVLKTLGMGNVHIRAVFIYNALYILLLALFLGNLLGLAIAFLQSEFGFLKLDEESYYLSQVPIHFDLSAIFYINVGTILLTLLVMIIPTYLITKIDPTRILRFD